MRSVDEEDRVKKLSDVSVESSIHVPIRSSPLDASVNATLVGGLGPVLVELLLCFELSEPNTPAL